MFLKQNIIVFKTLFDVVMKINKRDKVAKLILSFFVILTCVQLFISNTTIAVESDMSYDICVSVGGNITSIQVAIDSAEKNDIIFIENGVYYGNIVIDKAITIVGEDKTQTIIDGRNAGNVFKINVENVTIKHVTIQNSGIYFPNAGINLSTSHATIENSILKNNFYGMVLFNAKNNTIQNNTIQDNDHCGIYLSHSSNNNFFNNNISNQNYNGFGLYDESNNNLIINNTLKENGYCAVNIRISSMNAVIRNNISDNNIGIHVPSMENTISNNSFSNNNKDYDYEKLFPGNGEELLTPGFLAVILIFSLMFIVFYIRLIHGKQ